jgi:hypothetical protein
MTTDYRALCAELLSELQVLRRAVADEIGCPSPEPSVVLRARAALAQPEPEGVTDEDLLEEWYRLPGESKQDVATFARAVLARYARPAIEPVPVSERLPGPEDCDAEGRCWLRGKVEGDWRLLNPARSGVPQLKYCFSHHLPHHALPIPTPTIQP